MASHNNGGDDPQQEQRAQILAINRNPDLSRAEKSRLIQNLMTQKWRAANPIDDAPVAPSGADEVPTYHDADLEILGCQHYARRVKLRAPCCGTFFTCRRCHDETSNHEMDRFAVKEVMCMLCATIQEPATHCVSCRAEFARYSCLVCHFFEDRPEKQVFHCADCGLCRVGKGLGIDYFHCHTCDMCLSMDLMDNHICIAGKMKNDCPVCLEDLFTSTKPLMILPNCGHSLHLACYTELVKTSITCPLCSKSVGDLSSVWESLDVARAETPMPPEFAETTANVMCNDCLATGSVAYHFLYHKCGACGSYNTRVLDVDRMPVYNDRGEVVPAADRHSDDDDDDRGVGDLGSELSLESMSVSTPTTATATAAAAGGGAFAAFAAAGGGDDESSASDSVASMLTDGGHEGGGGGGGGGGVGGGSTGGSASSSSGAVSSFGDLAGSLGGLEISAANEARQTVDDAVMPSASSRSSEFE